MLKYLFLKNNKFIFISNLESNYRNSPQIDNIIEQNMIYLVLKVDHVTALNIIQFETGRVFRLQHRRIKKKP